MPDKSGELLTQEGAQHFIEDLTKQLAELQAVADEVHADLAKFCTYMKVSSLAMIPAARFNDAKHALEAKRQKEAA